MNRLAAAPPRWQARQWRAWYDQYLLSNEWLQRRRLVLQRANGICEGCLSEPATQVHHLTYDHAGAEFAWELVAICDYCHTRFHDK
jgi:5-methylcytosine-specific restriction endonuclease McrA